jgi:Mn2+/Fe2+ NRAMP family transporter
VKNLTKVGLGVVTSIGGYLEAGSLGTALQAGARFHFTLLWPVVLGTICIAFLVEMTGRLAAVSKHPVAAAIRERFGVSYQVWPFAAQMLVDLLVLACEIGGAALALSMATGLPMQFWTVPVALLIWMLLWRGSFGTIENGVAVLGLVTLWFVAAAWKLGPDWHEVGRNLVRPPIVRSPTYAYLAVSILGATISPYMITFYSSGAIEEKWSTKDLWPNRIVAAIGMGFGSFVSMAVIIVAALALAPRGITAETFQDAARGLTDQFGRWGFRLFCAALFIGCLGAALELALDASYLTAQTFGWNWGEDQRPSQEARFPLVYTAGIAIAMLPSLAGIDPLQLTMVSMAITVIALPIVVWPLLVVMNDRHYLRSYTNGWVTNVAVAAIVLLGFVLAIAAVPLQFFGQ